MGFKMVSHKKNDCLYLLCIKLNFSSSNIRRFVVCTQDNFSSFLSLQPVRETREKQIQLWKELIIDFCRTQKVFVIGLEEDFPLFSNPAIESECFFLLVFYMSDVQLRSCVIYITLTIAFAKMNSRCLEIHKASDLEHQWNVKYQFM